MIGWPHIATRLLAGVGMCAAAVAASAQAYSFTDLGTAGQNSCATAINNAGQVVGTAGPSRYPAAMLWDGTTATSLTKPGRTGTYGFPSATNDRG